MTDCAADAVLCTVRSGTSCVVSRVLPSGYHGSMPRGCWRGEIGKRNRSAICRASALVGSNPIASTAASLTQQRIRSMVLIQIADPRSQFAAPKAGGPSVPPAFAVSTDHSGELAGVPPLRDCATHDESWDTVGFLELHERVVILPRRHTDDPSSPQSRNPRGGRRRSP